jgi:hypothetical protein
MPSHSARPLYVIDEGFIEGRIDPGRISNARALLITAELVIAQQTSERF